MKMLGIVLSAALVGVAGTALGQAPAGAPAGANGICKDGSYSMAVKKDGACRGHKGVQTWYVAAGTAVPAPGAAPAPAAMPAPTAAAAPKSMPAPTPVAPQSVPAAPAPTPAPASTASGSKRLSPEAAVAQKTAAPGGGPGLVWVNTASNVYHCNGDTFYGKTKAGKYMTEDQAKAAGAHGERGKTCVGK